MYRRQIVRQNIARCFPDWTDNERRALERKFYRMLFRTIREIVYGMFAGPKAMTERVQYFNSEIFDQSIYHHGGAIAMLSHIGCWEWMADYGHRCAERNILELNVYRQLKSPFFDRLMLRIRAKRGGECVEKNKLLRRMIELRRDGQPFFLGMLSDQKPNPQFRNFKTTFFGKQIEFLTGSEELGRKFGYPCFFAFITCPISHYYHVTFLPLDPTIYYQTQNNGAMSIVYPEEIAQLKTEIESVIKGDYCVTEKYARLLEMNIRHAPELWLWSHNRWKYEM